MTAKWLIFFSFLSPIILYAVQEDDIELFEFLATYEQSDNVFIDAEIDDKYEVAKVTNEENLINQNITKSESDE